MTECLLLALVVAASAPQAGAQVVLSVELNEWYSCPFVYTWGGATYELDNDIYSVGRGADREYTDYLLLRNSVVPRDGVYSFEIREVPAEQSWTDTLSLIVIDHPTGVNVGVDSSGNAHSYGNPSPPDAAQDGSGNDVKSQLLARDYNALGMSHNDVVVLDFSSVDTTAGAKLVLDVDGFEGQLAGTPTGQVPAIEIQTLAGGAWITRHSFFPKEFRAVGVFDLQAYLVESKTIRLVSISCDEAKYHLIDYVALDNTADTLTYSVLQPATAVLNGQTDVLSEISSSDGVYAYTQGQDIIVVTFPFIPLADEQRNFAFVSKGYYTPGENNSYYLDTWNGSMWVYRRILTLGWLATDTIRTSNLSMYLPDPDGEYKIRIRNSMPWSPIYAQVDWVSLSVNGVPMAPFYAKEYDTTDILSQVITSDDVKWDAMNKWAVFKFSLNRPPAANPNGPYAGFEGSAVVFDGSASSDPDGDELTYTWDFGDGATGTGAAPTHIYADNGTYNVSLTVSDGELSNTQGTTAQIANVSPTLGPIAATVEVVPVGTEVGVAASFSDPGTADTHTSSCDWGDGAIETPHPSTSPVTDVHTYTTTGIYTVKITVTDDDGGASQSEFTYVVVYDPTDGFVTGGGWFWTRGGPYPFPDPYPGWAVEGKANFGFVAKYVKGATVPTGNTEFQFKADDLNFSSSRYDWLVVTGSNYAKFKGTGTINGAGEYEFQVWAGDNEPDTFRIKIWTEDESGVETIRYDNGFNGTGYENGQPISGGSIVIHTQ